MEINSIKAFRRPYSNKADKIKLANKRAHDKDFKTFKFDLLLIKNYERLAGLSFESFSSVLDIGCGSGTVLVNIAAQMRNTVKVKLVGVDISIESLKYCKDNAEKAGISAYCVVADIENLPFKDDVFDLVIAKDVLHHAPDNRRIFQEAHMRLSKDGCFVFMEPTFLIDVVSEIACAVVWWFPRFVRLLFGKSHKQKMVKELGEHPHVLPLRCKTLESLAMETGFSVINRSFAGQFFARIAQDVLKPIELRLKFKWIDLLIVKIKNLSRFLDDWLAGKNGFLSTIRSQVVFALKKEH